MNHWQEIVYGLGFGGLGIISLLTCWSLLVLRKLGVPGVSGLHVMAADLICVVSALAWLWSVA